MSSPPTAPGSGLGSPELERRAGDNLVIIGTGGLGSALGLSALLRGTVQPAGLMLFDHRPGRAAGVAADLDEAARRYGLGQGVTGGSDPAALEQARRVVVCAGYPPIPGLDPLETTAVNRRIGRQIGEELGRRAGRLRLVVVASSPCAAVAEALREGLGSSGPPVLAAWTAAEEARELELCSIGGAGTARFGAAAALVGLLEGC